MGIRDDLAERDASFVSLRTLLEQICEIEHVNLQQAADWLSEKLFLTDENERPTWCELTPGRGVLYVAGNRQVDARQALQYVVRNGKFATNAELDPDDIPF